MFLRKGQILWFKKWSLLLRYLRNRNPSILRKDFLTGGNSLAFRFVDCFRGWECKYLTLHRKVAAEQPEPSNDYLISDFSVSSSMKFQFSRSSKTSTEPTKQFKHHEFSCLQASKLKNCNSEAKLLALFATQIFPSFADCRSNSIVGRWENWFRDVMLLRNGSLPCNSNSRYQNQFFASRIREHPNYHYSNKQSLKFWAMLLSKVNVET